MATPTTVNAKPLDPVKQARERLDAKRYPPQPTPAEETPFVQHVRQQMALLEGEIPRLEAQIEALTQTCADRREQLRHLAAYLAVVVQAKP